MYALDAADGESGGGVVVANSLIQALLGYDYIAFVMSELMW